MLLVIGLDYICMIMYTVESIFTAVISRDNHGKSGKCADDFHLTDEETEAPKRLI